MHSPFAPSPHATLLASCGSTDLLEDGPRLLLVERGGTGRSVTIFVAVIMVVLFGIQAVLSGLVDSVGFPREVALLFSALFLVALVVLVVTLRAQRNAARQPASTLPVVLVIDRAQGAVLDPTGRPLTPLSGAVFQRQMQFGSSSSALAVAWNGGSQVIARGSPFTGSVDDILEALRARGFAVR